MRGYDYFVVVQQQVEPKTRYAMHYNTFDYWYGGGYGYRLGLMGPVLDGAADPITRYDAYAEIKLYKGPSRPAGPSAYDAREVMKRLGPRIVRPQPG
jgi:hypothetical protein